MQKSNQSEKYLLIRCIYSTKKKNFVFFFLQKQFVKLELQFGRASLDYVSISQKLSSFLAYRSICKQNWKKLRLDDFVLRSTELYFSCFWLNSHFFTWILVLLCLLTYNSFWLRQSTASPNYWEIEAALQKLHGKLSR